MNDFINHQNRAKNQSDAQEEEPEPSSSYNMEDGSGENPSASSSPPPPSEAPSTRISPHYDDKRDVIAQIECLSDTATKRISQAIWGATAAGLGLLIAGLVLVTTKAESYWFQNSSIFIVNTVFASFQILALGIMSIYFTRRIIRATLTGKRWSRRRLRGVQLSALELTLQLVNSILFLIPNADALVHDCKWFSSLVVWTSFGQWTIWNSFFLIFLIQASDMIPLPQQKTKEEEEERSSSVEKDKSQRPHSYRPRWIQGIISFLGGLKVGYLNPISAVTPNYSSNIEPTIYMDAPLWIHWPKLSLWILMEACLLGLTIDLDRHPAGLPVVPTTPATTQKKEEEVESCKYWEYTENFTTVAKVLSNLVAASSIVYLVLYCLIIFYSFRLFYALPYTKFRMSNIILRLQVRQRALSFAFFIATIIVYFYVRRGTLSAFILSWYGLTPIHIVNTIAVIAQSYLASPKKPNQAAILQVWLSEFAWTEDDVDRKKSERVSSLPLDSFEGFCMDCEPLFCFETAVKLMYWSFLAYDTGERLDSPFTSAAALGLYNLEYFDVVWERAVNTKAVIGWTDDPRDSKIVISFRGTASATNFFSDLEVWRTRHPEGVGTPLLGTAPLVHKGFLKTYTKNGFNDRLLSKVEHILNRCQEVAHQNRHSSVESLKEKPPIKVMLTGHSLGGALAILCSYDVATRTHCAEYDVDISCYTFGAPRVGNHAWAREYNSKISETWQLINSDDVITRAGKFFFLFKHVGHRVLLNRRGDLVVRPSFVEYAIRRSPGGSVKDHYLTSYERAVVAVLAAQFGTKSFNLDAKEGARALAHSAGQKKLLDRAGLSLEDVERLEEGRGQLTRLKSEARSSKFEMKREGEEEESGGFKSRVRQWVDAVASKCMGRRELEPIVAREETEVAAVDQSGGGREVETEAQMEGRQLAESRLLHCREICSEIGSGPARGRRCPLKRSQHDDASAASAVGASVSTITRAVQTAKVR